MLLGLAWLAGQEESPVAEVAERATAKIEAMLPPRPCASVSCDSRTIQSISSAPASMRSAGFIWTTAMPRRASLRAQIVWPIELYRYDDSGMIAAWCGEPQRFSQLPRIPTASSRRCTLSTGTRCGGRRFSRNGSYTRTKTSFIDLDFEHGSFKSRADI